MLSASRARRRASVAAAALLAACVGRDKITGPDGGSGVAVAAVTVSPPSAQVAVGSSVQLAATPRDSGGKVLSGRPVSWGTNAPGVVSVSVNGMVTALQEGTASVVATSEGHSGSASITVTRAPVASVGVAPTSATLHVGLTVQLSALVRDAAGNLLNGRTVTWATSAPTVVGVSPNGVVTALAIGTALVSATSEGKTGSATITVSPVPVASVTVSPSAASIRVGSTAQLGATVRDSAGNELSGRLVTWATNAPSVVDVSPSGLVTGLSAGTALVTATSEGKSATATVTVTLVPVASVTITPTTSGIFVGQAVQLAATLRDSAGNVLTGRVVSWSTNAPSVATVSPGGVVAGVGVGVATISATSESKVGTATVTVSLVPVASVTVTPGAAAVTIGNTVQLSATPRDSAGNALTGRPVTWSTNASGIATVSSTGVVTGVAVGTATITALSEGKSGTATITVSLPPVASVEVSPASPTVQAGATVQLTATLRDANGNLLTGRGVTWLSGDGSIAAVSPSGLVAGVASGVTTVTAMSEGQSGGAAVTVLGWVLVGAGDIADASTTGDEATAALLDSLVALSVPTMVFTAGDNAYEDGTFDEFQQNYDPTWGRHKSITRPAPGNHDYNTAGAAGYFQYFGSLAGPDGVGYFSYDWGTWHIISLNSNVERSAGSIQEQWLRADLAATPRQCVLAYWHHPRFSSGNHGSDSSMAALFDALYDYNVEVLVVGHDHHYERFAPQNANGGLDTQRGVREFVVGTGGTTLRGVGTPVANSETLFDNGHGVIKFTLNDGSYSWEFIPEAGQTFTDSGSGTCR